MSAFHAEPLTQRNIVCLSHCYVAMTRSALSYNNNKNNNKADNVYGAVIVAKPLREFTWPIW